MIQFALQTNRGTDVSKYFSFIHPVKFSLKVFSRENTQKKVPHDANYYLIAKPVFPIKFPRVSKVLLVLLHIGAILFRQPENWVN